MENDNVLTHETVECSLDDVVEKYKKKITERGDTEDARSSELLNLLQQMTEFEFGKSLLINRGATGPMTSYINLYPKRKHEYNIKNEVERLILESPMTIASQQRFEVCQDLLKKHIRNGMSVCSLPCGIMDDLITLELPKSINVKFVGIDIDQNSISGALENAKRMNVDQKCQFYKMDAWKLKFKNEFDILTSNGLIQYVEKHADILKFYKIVYEALKENGIFIVSCFIPPSTLDSKYKSFNILQIFSKDILKIRFNNFQTEEQISKDLIEIGFENIEVHYDDLKISPTILAIKKIN